MVAMQAPKVSPPSRVTPVRVGNGTIVAIKQEEDE